MRTSILIFMLMLLASCMTEKRATKKIARLGIQYPYSGATFCANAYPSRVEYKQTIEYKEGKHDTLWQAEYIDCDTVIGTDRIVKVPYPVIVPSRDTLIFRDSIFTENKAKLEATEREKNRAEAEAKAWKKKSRRNAVYGFLTGFITYFVVITLIKR
jgi:hypothetical protein